MKNSAGRCNRPAERQALEKPCPIIETTDREPDDLGQQSWSYQMKTLLAIGASAFVMGLATVGGAQAQSLSDTIGGGLIGLQGTFANGNWANQAVNVGAINGGIVLGQAGAETLVNIDAPTLNVNLEAAAGGGLAIIPPALSIAAGAELELGLDLGATSTAVRTIGEIASSAEIATTVVGALNTGDVASAVSSTALRASNSTTASTGSLSTSVGSATSAAANTSNTASSATASQLTSLTLEGPSTTVTAATEALTNGPLTDLYASNLAYNVGVITGNVAAIANSMDLAGVSTTVVGALNTGTISMGFDGSAFNQAITADLPN
jgi:hypothetical protein